MFNNLNVTLKKVVVIFLIITLIGGLIYGKDSMGLGDIKFIGALGLYFGLQNIVVISVIAFLFIPLIDYQFINKEEQYYV